MKRKIKWMIIGVVLVGISCVLYLASKPAGQPDPNARSNAITMEVTKETLINTVEVKGKSLYEQETLIYAPFGSRVAEWTAADGQQVGVGDILFKLDQTKLQNEITQQEAVIHKAKLEANLSDFTSRLSEGTVGIGASEVERGQAFAAKETAKLTKELNEVTTGIQQRELAEKQAQLQEAQFRATAAGILLYDNPGRRPQAVTDNQYIGKIVDLNKLQLIALVGEQDIFRIKPGMAVQVKMSAMKQLKLSGEVLKVSKFAKSGTDGTALDQTAQFEVVIGLEPSEYLIAGLSLTGQIETERKNDVTVVPTIAVIREQDNYFVTLDKGNGQYEKKQIKPGMETPEKTEVLEGLQAGDIVVLQ